MLTGRWWGPCRWQAFRPSAGLKLRKTQLRSVSSAPLETITFFHRDFFWSPPPFNHSKISPRRMRKGGRKIRLDKAWPLINFQRPTAFVQLPGGKVQGFRPPSTHPPTCLYKNISSAWSCSSLCRISAQLNLWEQMAHDSPSDKSLFVQTLSRGAASHCEWWHSRKITRWGGRLEYHNRKKNLSVSLCPLWNSFGYFIWCNSVC